MKTAILIGAGTSINEGIELGLWDKIKGLDIWSLNYAFKIMPYCPSRELWVDISFYRNNIQELNNLYNNGVKCYTKQSHHYTHIPEIIRYNATRDPKKIDDKTLFIGRMGLVGFFALSLAVKEQYNTIFCLGYDFGCTTYEDRYTHFYQNKIKVESTGIGNISVYRQLNGNVKPEVKDFEVFLQSKSKIYNVSLFSNINCYDKLSYEEFFTKINQNDKTIF